MAKFVCNLFNQYIMKKILLLILTTLLTLSMQAKVGLIIPADNRSAAETAAYDWFNTTYVTPGTGAFISLDTIPTTTTIYSAIWVMVDRSFTGDNAAQISSFNGLFGDTQKTALANFVKAGGNLLLTKQATYLAYTMGRIGYAPEFATYRTEGDWNAAGRAIGTCMGSGDYISNQSNHSIYKGANTLSEPLKQYEGNKRIFLMHTANSSNYRYCGWLEVYNKNLAKGGGNASSAIREAFENDWQATILALRGGIGDYCFTDIIFFKKGEDKTAEGRLNFSDWKGNILAIGSAAYWWGSDNADPELTNVKELTKNSLSYLETLRPKVANPAAKTAFLLMAADVASLPSAPERNAANEFAKKYFAETEQASEGRYISLSDLSSIPSTVKTIIIHADRTELFNWSSYKENLKTWVKNGGNLVLLRQATKLAYEMGRIDYAPYCQALSNDATGDNNPGSNQYDKIRVKVGISGINDCGSYDPCYVDRSSDDLFANMTIVEDGNNKLITLNNGGAAKNRCYWQEIKGDNAESATYSRVKFEQFQTRYNCEVLAVEGYVEDFCLASIIRFKKGTVPADSDNNWKGTILAIGAGGFQYTDGNSANFGMMTTLVKNGSDALLPDPCTNCFTITF